MTDLFNRLDFYISLIGIGLVVYLWGRRWWRRFIMSRSAPTIQRTDQVRYLDNYTEIEPENEPEPLTNPALQSRTDARTGAFVLNPDECAAVAKMIEHKTTAEKPTKASIIWAGFATKKGDSAKYRRASEIYDALFVIPPPTDPYPTLNAERRRARDHADMPTSF